MPTEAPTECIPKPGSPACSTNQRHRLLAKGRSMLWFVVNASMLLLWMEARPRLGWHRNDITLNPATVATRGDWLELPPTLVREATILAPGEIDGRDCQQLCQQGVYWRSTTGVLTRFCLSRLASRCHFRLKAASVLTDSDPPSCSQVTTSV